MLDHSIGSNYILPGMVHNMACVVMTLSVRMCRTGLKSGLEIGG